MAKKIICKPAPEIELELGGGEKILLRFDLYSVMNLQEYKEGGIGEVLTQSVPEVAAAIVYAAGKNNNENFTLEKARLLVANMSVDSVTEIINEYSASIGSETNALDKEYSKK